MTLTRPHAVARQLGRHPSRRVLESAAADPPGAPQGVDSSRPAPAQYVIGYGQNIDIPTIDVISREVSFIGNLVGTYVDLQDLMTLTWQGQVTLHTSKYPLDAINDAMADLDQGRLQGRGILVPAGA
jgi:NAD+-dependent secondary alcohol dehydrogenase Adh1